MKYIFTLILILFFTTPSFAQKAILPGKIIDAGGEFEIESFVTTLDIRPYAESINAQINVRVVGVKGSVNKLMFIFNGGRRVYSITDRGKRLKFTHVGDFLTVDLENEPLQVGENRQLVIRYTGKVHSVSSTKIKNFKIDRYTVRLTVIPNTGSMEGVANLEIVGYKKEEKPLIDLNLKELPSPPPLPENELSLVLNNNYVVDRIFIGNQQSPFTHSNGYINIDLLKTLAPNERRQVRINYFGKIRNSDKNRLWDNFDNAPFEVTPYGVH